MQWQLVFFSMAPVVVFAVARRSTTPVETALAVVATAALELAWNSVTVGFLEPFSAASLALFVVAGAVALRRDELRYLQLQPVILECLVAGVLLYYTFVLGKPLFATVVEEYVGLIDWLEPWRRGYFRGYALTMSKTVPFLLLVHAGLTAYATYRLSFAWWLVVRIPGLYVLLTVLFYAERLLEGTG